MRRRLPWRTLGATAALGIAAAAGGMAPASATDPSMATIRVERPAAGSVRFGTAFRVSDHELVTAAHTVAGCASAAVAGAGSIVSIEIAAGGVDVAVVTVPPTPGRTMELDDRMPAVGAAATHIGYSTTGVVLLRTRAIGLAWMVADSGAASVVQVYGVAPGDRARYGMSGSPILVDGRVVGVHVAEQPRRGRVLAVPIGAATRLIAARAGVGTAETRAMQGATAPGPGAVRVIRCEGAVPTVDG